MVLWTITSRTQKYKARNHLPNKAINFTTHSIPGMEMKIRMKSFNINNKTKGMITDGHRVKVLQINLQVQKLIEASFLKTKIRDLKAQNYQEILDWLSPPILKFLSKCNQFQIPAQELLSFKQLQAPYKIDRFNIISF